MLTLTRRNTQSYNGTIIYKHFFATKNMKIDIFFKGRLTMGMEVLKK